jgi:hypothetical protein
MYFESHFAVQLDGGGCIPAPLNSLQPWSLPIICVWMCLTSFLVICSRMTFVLYASLVILSSMQQIHIYITRFSTAADKQSNSNMFVAWLPHGRVSHYPKIMSPFAVVLTHPEYSVYVRVIGKP